MRSYHVVVDGVRRGSVKRGETFTLDLEPGNHTVEARISWTGSEPVVVQVEAGRQVRLVAEPAGTVLEGY